MAHGHMTSALKCPLIFSRRHRLLPLMLVAWVTMAPTCFCTAAHPMINGADANYRRSAIAAGATSLALPPHASCSYGRGNRGFNFGSSAFVSTPPCVSQPARRSTSYARDLPFASLSAGTSSDDTDAADDDGGDEQGFTIIRGDGEGGDQISQTLWEELEANAPPKIDGFKQILGINIFTYVLAALIVFFVGMNVFLGPGWLGQNMGLVGTGSFTEVSENLPMSIDLSRPENLL